VYSVTLSGLGLSRLIIKVIFKLQPPQKEVAMSFDGLSIRRTGKGQFVLVHMDSIQKVKTEKQHSSDFEEIVDRLIEGHEINHAKDKSILDYGPILAIINSLSERYPHSDDEGYPENWTEPPGSLWMHS
jgi:hypothetical protein